MRYLALVCAVVLSACTGDESSSNQDAVDEETGGDNSEAVATLEAELPFQWGTEGEDSVEGVIPFDQGFIVAGTSSDGGYYATVGRFELADTGIQNIWTREFRPQDRSGSVDIKEDVQGNILLLVNSWSDSDIEASGASLIKLNPAGESVWTQNLLSDIGAVTVYGLAVNSSGSTYVVGTKGSRNSGGEGLNDHAEAEAFVAAFDQDGNLLWEDVLGKGLFSSSSPDTAATVAVLSSGRIVITGNTDADLVGTGPVKTWSVFVRTYEEGGDINSTFQYFKSDSGFNWVQAAGTDLASNVFLHVQSHGFFKVDPAGQIVFSDDGDWEGVQMPRAWSIIASETGDIFVVGATNGSNTFGESLGGNDGFIAHFSNNLELLNSTNYGTSEDDAVYGLYIVDQGLFVGGTTRGVVGAESAGELDFFVALLNSELDEL